MFLCKKKKDFFDDFLTCRWRLASKNRRLLKFQELENNTAKEQGRVARLVTICSSEKLGYFNHVTSNKLFINQIYVDSNDPCIQYDGINTVIHEGVHAYQNDCINRIIECKNTIDAVSVWQKNDEIYYLPEEDYLKYYFQPIEICANTFAIKKLLSFECYFNNDGFYFDYIDSITEEHKSNCLVAKERFGTNFVQDLADKICRKYAWKHRYNPSQETKDNAFFALLEYGKKKYGEEFRRNCEEYIINDPIFCSLYRLAFPDDKFGYINIFAPYYFREDIF